MKIPDELEGAFKARATDCSKYTIGVVAVVGGTCQYPNAPVIAGLGARAGGAGLVRLVVPDASRHCAGALLPEATFVKLDDVCEIPKADVTVIGMGLGRDEAAEGILAHFLSGRGGRFVVDADALAILAQHGTCAQVAGREIVLTPHEGEAARLLGVSREDVAADRTAAAREIAGRYCATVVLKGPGTIVASRDAKRIYTNTTGNPFMALGGMGDLLSGVIGARWAYLGADPFLAAASAAWLHGAASDGLVASGGDPSIANTATHIGAMRTRLDGMR